VSRLAQREPRLLFGSLELCNNFEVTTASPVILSLPQANFQPDPPYQIAAYVTAYEDAEALNACVSAIKAQSVAVNQILIVDNSFEPLPLTLNHQQDATIVVWSQPENIGIAGGLEMAVEWSLQQGFDFLWMFDQDSTPLPDCLALLLQTYTQSVRNDYPIGIVAPTPVDARTGEVIQASRFLGDKFKGFPPPATSQPYECDAPITSGSLLWIETARRVSPPDREFFMDGIDLEYGLCLRNAGFHHLVVPAAKMYHRFGTPVQVKLLGQQKAFQIYSALRYYYICRNQTHIELHHSQGLRKLTCALWRLRYLVFSIGVIALLDTNHKVEKVYACLLGTYHGFIGKLGKTWQAEL
jgi:rhamnosyltransferase